MIAPLAAGEMRVGAVSRLFTAMTCSAGALRTSFMRRWAGIRIGPDGVQIEPHQLRSHARVLRRLVREGHVVVVKNGGDARLAILRLSADDNVFPDVDDESLLGDDINSESKHSSSWLD